MSKLDFDKLLSVTYPGLGKVLLFPKNYKSGDGAVYFTPKVAFCIPSDELAAGKKKADVLKNVCQDALGDYFLLIQRDTEVRIANEADVTHYSLGELIA